MNHYCIHKMRNTVWRFRAWCVFGLLLSVYATYVEIRAEYDTEYQALCDLSDKIRCTTVFTSEYGKGFGLTQIFSTLNLPNGVIGTGFYLLMLLLIPPRNRSLALLQLLICFISNFFSVFLAYLLYYVLKELCVVCATIYAVNLFCTFESWSIYNYMYRNKRYPLSNVQNDSDKNK